MSNLLRRKTGTLVAFTAILLLLASSFAGAATSRQSEIEQEKAALRAKIRDAEARARSITQQIADSDRRRSELESRIASLSAQLAGASNRLTQAEQALEVARGDLFSAEDSLSKALSRLDRLQSQHNERARTFYKSGAGTYVEVLLAARDLDDFVTRLALVRSAMREDTARQKAVERLTDQLTGARTEAVQHKTDIEQQKSKIEAEKATITRLQQEVKRSREQVLAELANRKQLLIRVQAEKAQYLLQMQRLEQESRSISLFLRSRQAGQVYKGASGLVWPTTGYVSSGFGWRIHPIFGDRRFHTGIDIAAPAGQAIVASLAGVVVFAGYKNGYGLTVIIDHGNAFATVYAHMSAAAVYSGVKVAKASRIGSVGCTGYCTGPHVHFETRIKGEPVDPMQFF